MQCLRAILFLSINSTAIAMSIIVQKFGGTSVADSQKILAAARTAIRAQNEGHQVVMVVSAMGKNTDVLVSLAAEISDSPPAREMDMLLTTGEQVSVALMAMAIDSLGYRGVSLTGAQIGIRTDSIHTQARIKSISTERMQRLLDRGNIVIAAGFQGIDEDFNITTLGRGGSDTTAVALAAVLGADVCEIYTDVDGVYTTDPKILPEARRVQRISYDEMLELASLGAGVMHNRSIEFAKKYGVPIQVRNSMTDSPGTLIDDEAETEVGPVCGCALTRDEARVTVTNVPNVPGSSWEVFSRIADRNVTVDMIVQNDSDERADISFTVPKEELDGTLEAAREAVESLGAGEVLYDDQVSKVSVVGVGMAEQRGVAESMFGALAEAGVNIQMITTSEIKISALVHRDQAQVALRAVHKAFRLGASPAPASVVETNTLRVQADAADVVTRLRGVDMEELVINTISLDSNQASVTIVGVPDEPGIAAKVFRGVADGGVFVDMIIQSFDGREGERNLTFTVPRSELEQALVVAESLGGSLGCKRISNSPAIAKLTVSGIGLRSHTGVAIRMFRSLADAGINVQMINTSEIRVNVVVDGANGPAALESLEAAFQDSQS